MCRGSCVCASQTTHGAQAEGFSPQIKQTTQTGASITDSHPTTRTVPPSAPLTSQFKPSMEDSEGDPSIQGVVVVVDSCSRCWERRTRHNV